MRAMVRSSTRASIALLVLRQQLRREVFLCHRSGRSPRDTQGADETVLQTE
jgi:hypothetical protein